MANTIQLQRRIKTAQNVSKTTRAMQMISASKLKRAQEAALASRPYVHKLTTVTRSLTTRLDKQSMPTYMKKNESVSKKLVIIISPDKGLCGGMVTNLAREVLHKKEQNDVYITMGKKMENNVIYLGKELIAAFPFGNTLPSFDVVYPIVKIINEHFMNKKVSEVEIISTHFTNIFIQKPHVTKLLPVLPHEESAKEEKKSMNHFQLFEPDLETILPALLERYIEMALYQEIIESYLSEQAARMLSMQNATNNAKDIIEDLRLEYNKTRQAKITSELLDIAGAATI